MMFSEDEIDFRILFHRVCFSISGKRRMKQMSSLERVRAVIRGPFELDRIPVIPIMRFTAISLMGYRLGETFDHWEKIAEAETEAWRRFGYDGIFARMTYDVDVAALGGNILFHGDTPPQVGPPYLVSSIDDIDRIKEPDPDLCLWGRKSPDPRLVEQWDEVPVIDTPGPPRFASSARPSGTAEDLARILMAPRWASHRAWQSILLSRFM
jgi:hypothetical protein